LKIIRAVDENVGWLLGEQGFGLSSDEGAKIQTAAVILIDLTRGDNERLTSLRAIASRSKHRRKVGVIAVDADGPDRLKQFALHQNGANRSGDRVRVIARQDVSHTQVRVSQRLKSVYVV
jgi:hypothetical protein